MCNWAILTAVFYTLYIATINIYTKHFNAFSAFAFSALTPLALGVRKSIRPVKIECCWDADMVICL